MDNPWVIVAQAAALLLGAAAALLSAKVTKLKNAAERNLEKSAEKDAIIKKIGDKADSIVPLLLAMFAVEQELDGYERNCGRCGQDPEYCSPQAHEAEKKERVMRLMQKWYQGAEAEFDFSFLDSKYNELKFSVLQYKQLLRESG